MKKFFCGNCGFGNSLNNSFCNECGAKLKAEAFLNEEYVLPDDSKVNEVILNPDSDFSEDQIYSVLKEPEVEIKGKKSDNIKIVFYIIGVIILILIYLEYTSHSNAKPYSSDAASQQYHAYTEVGETLKTNMFEITVNSVKSKSNVNTGNVYSDLKQENGSFYLVLNVTFKNVDKESRMVTDGEIIINYNNTDYKFDHSETIAAEGWGLFLDQINPLTSKTTNLVYKVPTELKGQIFWHPGRTDEDEKILLGTL
jgi:hypothetical protein